MTDTYRVEVFWRGGIDGRVVDLLDQIAHLGLDQVDHAAISNLYFLRGKLTPGQIDLLATELLVDPVVEGYRWSSVPATHQAPEGYHVIEVGFHPGVTDPVATHLLSRAKLLDLEGLEAVTTGQRYEIVGELDPIEVHQIAGELLANEVIQSYSVGPMTPEFVPDASPSSAVDTIPLLDLNDAQLVDLSVNRVLFLSLPEMRAIRREFRKLEREPTDVELETLAQTWSEHCLHKTFKARIDYRCSGGMPRLRPEAEGAGNTSATRGDRETIESLIRSYLREATESLARPWVRSAFVDNAGIVEFDDVYEISFKVETHNHPSALEPFGGANTGVGGVIRDIIGVSARPIANSDVLCFGPLDMRGSEVPLGTLHPRRIARGVVAGIEDYGNKMGIPTVSGAILYHEDYVANPLVYCGCVGIAPKGVHRTEPQPNDLVVALGGRTGRDGLHGATFSSAELTHETGETVGSVVQIGDPITEKAVLDAVMQARDEGLYSAITDCGAGGFSSAVGEMGHEVGVDVELQDVPLKYPGLRPWEIWLSEAQERMVLAVPESNLARLGEICAIYNVEWTVIGRFTGDGQLRVHYGDQLVADMPMAFVHKGWPRPELEAVWTAPDHPTPQIPDDASLTAILLAALAHPDVASKEAVIRRYDHEVQGATMVKPLVGVADDGPSDAAVLRPLMAEGQRGIALGCGVNPHLGRVDPYAMAWAAIDEAIRNVVCVGADPDRVALLDNFCWGNPALPDRLGSLVRAAQGCYDAALAYGTPFISGKDSLNNEFVDAHGDKRTIPPTLLISSLGIVPDVTRAVTMDLKQAGDVVYLIGETRAELGGSLYHRLHGALGGAPPTPVADAPQTFRALHSAVSTGYVRAIHDLSEGGLAVAAAEMAIAGRMGLQLELIKMMRNPAMDADRVVDTARALLFSESNSRFLVEVSSEDAEAFEAQMVGRPCARIGVVTESPVLRMEGLDGQAAIEAAVDDLVEAWQSAEIV
ncbi:MAG: phosphoribosylformylglycinamidine synthase subunit PurL [Anaerolineae bacterium]